MHDEKYHNVQRAQRWSVPLATTFACLCLTFVLFSASQAFGINIPPEVEIKKVILEKDRTETARLFQVECGKCHQVPDPADPSVEKMKSGCASDLSQENIARTHAYLTDVRQGKKLYEENCNRCHVLIEPSTYSADYWSSHMCSSDGCMVKRRLTGEEEQQVLQYLTSHARKE